MARYGKSSRRKRYEKNRVAKSQRKFIEYVIEITGRTFWELVRLARLPYKPRRVEDLRFDEADLLCNYCYVHIEDIVKNQY